jgi:hypothetical protein
MARVVGVLYNTKQIICPVQAIRFLPLMPMSVEDMTDSEWFCQDK